MPKISHHEWGSIQRSCFETHEWWEIFGTSDYFHTADKPPVLSSCITVEWFLIIETYFSTGWFFCYFPKFWEMATLCSEIETFEQRKEENISEEGKYARQCHYVLTPDRLADLVRGGSLTPDMLKIRPKSSHWMCLSECSTKRWQLTMQSRVQS